MREGAAAAQPMPSRPPAAPTPPAPSRVEGARPDEPASAVFSRMRALTRVNAGETVAARSAEGSSTSSRERPALPWTDSSRPAGSLEEVQAWAEARQVAGPDGVAFELHKLGECGLVVLPSAAVPYRLMLADSLLIEPAYADHPAAGNATGRLIHHSEALGTRTYLVVHSLDRIHLHPELQNATLRVGPSTDVRDELDAWRGTEEPSARQRP